MYFILFIWAKWMLHFDQKAVILVTINVISITISILKPAEYPKY